MELNNLILKFMGKIGDKSMVDNVKEKNFSQECAQAYIKDYKAVVIQCKVTSQRCTNTQMRKYLEADPSMIWKFVYRKNYIANQ